MPVEMCPWKSLLVLPRSQACSGLSAITAPVFIAVPQPQAGSQEGESSLTPLCAGTGLFFRLDQLMLSVRVFACLLIYICSASFQTLILPH